MVKKHEDLEEDLDLDDDDKDDSSEEEQDDGAGEEKPGAKKEKDDEEAVKLDSEDADDDEKKAEQEAKRVELRDRRKRERKMRRERDKSERLEMQRTIQHLSGQVKTLTEKVPQLENEVTSFNKQSYQSEVSELNNIYNDAQNKMAEAITNGDGETYRKAKAISDKAFARYNYLETQRAVKGNGSQPPKQSEQQNQPPASILDDRGKNYGTDWIKKNDWYDPSGTTRESKVVQTIDAELYSEGYDPNTKEYWDELTDRAKEFLPHRFKANGNGRQKQIVGGGGSDASSGSSSAEINLPKAFVANLKEAGQWDDVKKRKAAIKYYQESRKGA